MDSIHLGLYRRIQGIKERSSWGLYRQIQSIWVICYSLFLLASYTNSLQLTTENVYEMGVHVFIYGQTQS
jgi:hypothetical protein